MSTRQKLINPTQTHESPVIDEPIAMLRDVNGNGRFEGSEVFTYTKDHLGSVKDLTDANAELKQRYGYSAYGSTKLEKDDSHSSNKFIENPYAYTAREWEQETGCYYYRARWYCPMMEKFISEDPIGFYSGDFSKYRYTGNSPFIRNDPFGLQSMSCINKANEEYLEEVKRDVETVKRAKEEAERILKEKQRIEFYKQLDEALKESFAREEL
ncbi:MAG: RHS repeat-associated core domain-containing protein [Bdellovibrio sp.]|nr:RHS repeat-associated core domain-containing protein [Bdellovibrio sp.]